MRDNSWAISWEGASRQARLWHLLNKQPGDSQGCFFLVSSHALREPCALLEERLSFCLFVFFNRSKGGQRWVWFIRKKKKCEA